MAQIISFTGDYRFLSNFYPVGIEYFGHWYPSVEHAYQAAKTTDLTLRMKIRSCPTASMAKWQGNRVPLRDGWQDLRLPIMEDLVRQKFTQSAHLAASLRSTTPAELIEGNSWNDRFWGMCRGTGENHLGKILMKIRAELLLAS